MINARVQAALARHKAAAQDVATRLELAVADVAFERALATQITALEVIVNRDGVTPWSRACFAKLSQRVLLSDTETAAILAALP